MSVNLTFQEIGIFQGPTKKEYDIPRQGVFSEQSGLILLKEKHNFEQAIQGLQDFSRIWILYVFHHNAHWKPMVLPPRSPTKMGVFATRSPYRPNPIGICPARLLKVEGRKIFVDQVDLLDGTPILDIKPYLPESDSFPVEKTGWLESLPTWEISFTPEATAHIQFLERDLPFLKSFVHTQLSADPFNHKKKRLIMDANNTKGTLAYQTWRIHFRVQKTGFIEVYELSSGYTNQELESAEDPYKDKDLHLIFKAAFSVD